MTITLQLLLEINPSTTRTSFNDFLVIRLLVGFISEPTSRTVLGTYTPLDNILDIESNSLSRELIS